jgi:hypothetical protein
MFFVCFQIWTFFKTWTLKKFNIFFEYEHIFNLNQKLNFFKISIFLMWTFFKKFLIFLKKWTFFKFERTFLKFELFQKFVYFSYLKIFKI